MGKQAIDGATRGTFFWVDPDDLVIIGLDTKDGPEHPLYDPRIHKPLDEQRIQNIHFYGVLETIEARKNGDKLEVNNGRQRVRMARVVKQRQKERGEDTIKVPVMLVKASDADLFSRARAANIHDNDGPMTNAQNAARSLSMGKSIAEVAVSFGVTEQTIRNWQTMLELDPAVIDAMVKGEISSTAAIQVANLPKEDQRAVIAEVQEETKTTGAKPTVERVKRKANEKAGKTGNSPKERIERARNLLIKFTASTKTKEDAVNTLERLSKVLLGMGLDKLASDED